MTRRRCCCGESCECSEMSLAISGAAPGTSLPTDPIFCPLPTYISWANYFTNYVNTTFSLISGTTFDCYACGCAQSGPNWSVPSDKFCLWSGVFDCNGNCGYGGPCLSITVNYLFSGDTDPAGNVVPAGQVWLEACIVLIYCLSYLLSTRAIFKKVYSSRPNCHGFDAVTIPFLSQEIWDPLGTGHAIADFSDSSLTITFIS